VPLCSSEVGLPGIGTEPLVQYDQMMMMMVMDVALTNQWERSEYSVPILFDFQGFFFVVTSIIFPLGATTSQ
jgi:hypothetical protein